MIAGLTVVVLDQHLIRFRDRFEAALPAGPKPRPPKPAHAEAPPPGGSGASRPAGRLSGSC